MAKRNIKPRVRISGKPKKGKPFEVKTLVTHNMETGLRNDKETGKKLPRDIISKFVVRYNGNEVMRANWHPAVSSNPYTSFFVIADKSGPMEFTWTDDDGVSYHKTVQVKVTG